MTNWRRIAAILGSLLLVPLLVWGGVGFFGGSHYRTDVTINLPPASAAHKPPAKTVKIPCPGNQPGKVIYFANDPAAAKYRDFGVPLITNLSPLYEPSSTPRPDVGLVVPGTWFRLCHDPELTRVIVAAAYPNWPGLHVPFTTPIWEAALKLLAQNGKWSTAKVKYYATAPTPLTMMMVANPSGGRPKTYIVHAPFNGWYLLVRIGAHEEPLRLGCGDQPGLNVNGYQSPLLKLFPRA